MNTSLSQPEHLQKASNNQEFAAWVSQSRPQSADWSATGYFYSAVHYVDAYIHRYGRSADNHDERFEQVRKTMPREQARHYEELFNLSMAARYEAVQVDAQQLQRVLSAHYDPLIRWLRQRLGL